MKSLLKGAAILVLGIAIGCGATAFLLNRFHQSQLNWLRASQVGADALLAEMIREGNAQIVLEGLDGRIVSGVLELHQNEELRAMTITEISLAAAKRYYLCTKKELPPEIAPILRDLPERDGFQCPLPE